MFKIDTMSSVLACTTLAITDENNNIYDYRIFEFSSNEPTLDTSYYSQEHTFQRKAPDDSPEMQYQIKYFFLAITVSLNLTDLNDALQGVKSASLLFSLNMTMNSELSPLSSERYAKSVTIVFIGEWTLSQYTTIAELHAFLSEKLLLLRDILRCFHDAFYDSTGGCIIMGISSGKLQIYDHKVSNPNIHAHTMNKFGRPQNISIVSVLEKDHTLTPYSTKFSVWVVLMDLQRGTLFSTEYQDLNDQRFILGKFKNEKEPVFMRVNLSNAM